MSSSVTIEEAQAHLAELIGRLAPGDVLVITQDEKPVARIVSESGTARRTRQPGSAKGKLLINAEDDDHLKDFQEYM